MVHHSRERIAHKIDKSTGLGAWLNSEKDDDPDEVYFDAPLAGGEE
jgi:hypothetical protein